MATTKYNPTTWFVELEIARRRGDRERQRRAKEELRRLGVEVRYRRAAEAVEPQPQGAAP